MGQGANTQEQSLLVGLEEGRVVGRHRRGVASLFGYTQEKEETGNLVGEVGEVFGTRRRRHFDDSIRPGLRANQEVEVAEATVDQRDGERAISDRGGDPVNIDQTVRSQVVAADELADRFDFAGVVDPGGRQENAGFGLNFRSNLSSATAI